MKAIVLTDWQNMADDDCKDIETVIDTYRAAVTARWNAEDYAVLPAEAPGLAVLPAETPEEMLRLIAAHVLPAPKFGPLVKSSGGTPTASESGA